MAVTNNTIVGRATRKGGATIIARLTDLTGALITRASVAAINYTIQDMTGGTAPVTGSLPVSSVVFDSLQQGGGWTQDNVQNLGADGLTGWNLRWTVPAANFAFANTPDPYGNQSPHVFEVDLIFTPVSGENFAVRCVFPVDPSYS